MLMTSEVADALVLIMLMTSEVADTLVLMTSEVADAHMLMTSEVAGRFGCGLKGPGQRQKTSFL
jgi:hypothetical protein